MQQPTTKEDIASERDFFDDYYRKARLRDAKREFQVEQAWLDRAIHPRSRPLDYWEHTFYLLGDLRGKRVLEIGCGGGWISACLAAAGASVATFDVSIEGCRLTRDRLRAHAFSGESVAVMDAHDIAYRTATFDAVVMAGVLHHLNLEKVSSEVHRVLRPGGVAVCYEPLKYGPIMWKLRQLWLRLKGLNEYATTEHEEGLDEAALAPFRNGFRDTLVRRFNFVAKTNRLGNRFGPLANSLRWTDYVMLSLFPVLRRYCTCIVCRFVK